MRILLINPPHTSIGTRIPREHLPPLGLLAIGGPLIDSGHDVTLLDAEIGPLSQDEIVRKAVLHRPEAILIGHSGSTSAHPTVCELTRRFRVELPRVYIVYGGVFPTYHYGEILDQEPQIDVVVRGEGEMTVRKLMASIVYRTDLERVSGIAFRRNRQIIETPPAAMIEDLDTHRVGWELVDLSRSSYYGGRRAVVMQFSRGCPHQCNYCGQRGFWARWRHRDPIKFAKEMAWLHRSHGVELFNLADENPTGPPRPPHHGDRGAEALDRCQLEDYLWQQKAEVDNPLVAYGKIRALEGPALKLNPKGAPVQLPDHAVPGILIGEFLVAFVLALRAVTPR